MCGEESPDTNKHRASRSFGRSGGPVGETLPGQTVPQKTNYPASAGKRWKGEVRAHRSKGNRRGMVNLAGCKFTQGVCAACRNTSGWNALDKWLPNPDCFGRNRIRLTGFSARTWKPRPKGRGFVLSYIFTLNVPFKFRSISRLVSAALMLSLLSNFFLPRAKPISTLANPPLK